MACVLIVASTPPPISLQARLAGAVKLKTVSCLAAALEKVGRHKFNLVIWCATGLAARECGDLENTLAQVATIASRTKLVVLTSAEARLRLLPGCENFDVEQEPADENEWQQFVERVLPCQLRRNGRSPAPAALDVPIEFEGMITVSLPMRNVVRSALEAANVDVPVLITGETGTGKDLLAAGIHRRSQRKGKPFVAINTGAMPPDLIASEIFGHERGAYTGAQDCRPGIFEQAQGGTVFLDEIASMDAKTQVSLLRVLEEKSFRRVGGNKTISADVRIIAAANEDLEKCVAEKRFREDLFYRLNVFHIAVPALRDRPGAVTVLTDHFVAAFSKLYDKEIERVAPETYRLLRHYPWPGNVRELKNVIQTAVLMSEGKEITPEVVPQRIKNCSVHNGRSGESLSSISVGLTLGTVEKQLIELTLASVNGNKKQAASVLGISRRALYNKMYRHHLS
jgi:Response regulator containing CheY-like receiver, AAA-type ATPase, and DNA-binding domains